MFGPVTIRRSKGITECDGDRNDFSSYLTEDDALTDMDPAFVLKIGLLAFMLNCKVPLAKMKVQFRHDFIVGADGLDIFCNIGA